MTCDRRRLPGTRPLPPVWFHGLCTVGWGFLCLHKGIVFGFLAEPNVYGEADSVDYARMLVIPLVVLLRGLLYFRGRARWGWMVAAGAVAVTFTPGYWLSVSRGDAPLENALYLVAPTAFVVAWCCVGLIGPGLWGRRGSRAGAVQSYVAGVLAVAAGAYGLLQLLMPDLPGPSDQGVFLMTPVVVVETALCYAVISLGAWRTGSGVTGRGATTTEKSPG
jgi:hypothetical protein